MRLAPYLDRIDRFQNWVLRSRAVAHHYRRRGNLTMFRNSLALARIELRVLKAALKEPRS